MKTSRAKSEWDEVMEKHEITELKRLFDEYSVEYPPDAVMFQAIESCSQYIPKKKVHATSATLNALRERMKVEVSYIAPWFWSVSLILFITGLMLSVTKGLDPYKSVLFLAPVPFVLGVLELLRDSEEGMLELQRTCKASLHQVILARMVLIGLYNVLLNSMLSLTFSLTLGVEIWRVVLLWLTPFTWVAGATLLLASRIRGRALVPVVFCVWSVVGLTLTTSVQAMAFLTSLNAVFYVVVIALGFIMVWVQGSQLASRLGRGVHVEFAD